MKNILKNKHSFYVLCPDGGKPGTSGGFDIACSAGVFWVRKTLFVFVILL